MKKIFITGGHVTPALAVIEDIKKRGLSWELIFVGRKSALEGVTEDSEEYRLVSKAGIKFLPLSAGRLLRTFALSGLISLLKIPRGFFQALVYVLSEKPDLILTFGGYLALPVALAGAIFKIPIVTHEQTKELGLSNKVISLVSKKILVSDPDLLANLPSSKGFFTGLPIREELFHPPPKPAFGYDSHVPLIYITGGATGAQSLNEMIFPLISTLVKRFMIVHQTGGPSLVKALAIKKSLSGGFEKRYVAAKYFAAADLAWIYRHAVLVIGRSGANTTGELALLGKVAIFIPLPWSAGGEQKQNALVLAKAGSAVVLEQNIISSEILSQTIGKIMADLKIFQAHADNFSKKQIRDGTSRVVNELLSSIS